SRADVGDRAMPADQVDREEQPRPDRYAAILPGPCPQAPVLAPRDPTQHRQRVRAAEDCRGRWRGMAEPDQDAREGNRDRAEDRADPYVALDRDQAFHFAGD